MTRKFKIFLLGEFLAVSLSLRLSAPLSALMCFVVVFFHLSLSHVASLFRLLPARGSREEISSFALSELVSCSPSPLVAFPLVVSFERIFLRSLRELLKTADIRKGKIEAIKFVSLVE